VTKGSFAEAGCSLEMLLGLRLRTLTLKHMSRGVGRLAAAARGWQGCDAGNSMPRPSLPDGC
jgi:hypothetical protein